MRDYFNYLKMNNITPNGLFVLHAVKHDYMFINYINFKVEEYRLCLDGLLVEINEDDPSINSSNIKRYKLTSKGEIILKEAENIMYKMRKPSKKENVPFEEWEEYIDKYNALFPKGKKAGSTTSFRTIPKELHEVFGWFFKEYPQYTWEDVLTVTEKYINHFSENNDFTFMQTSKYLVKKQDKHKVITSNLATLCYNYKEGNDEEQSSGFYHFGD